MYKDNFSRSEIFKNSVSRTSYCSEKNFNNKIFDGLNSIIQRSSLCKKLRSKSKRVSHILKKKKETIGIIKKNIIEDENNSNIYETNFINKKKNNNNLKRFSGNNLLKNRISFLNKNSSQPKTDKNKNKMLLKNNNIKNNFLNKLPSI